MRVVLIALLVCSCSGYGWFEVQRVESDRKADVSTCLESIGWDIETATERRVETEWHRIRLRTSPLHVNEVQMRIVANQQRGTVVGLCTQRAMRADGANEPWRFLPCTDSRALGMIDEALSACGAP